MLGDSAKYKEFGSECLDAIFGKIFGKGEVFLPSNVGDQSTTNNENRLL